MTLKLLEGGASSRRFARRRPLGLLLRLRFHGSSVPYLSVLPGGRVEPLRSA